MKISGKVIAAIAVVIALSVAALLAQRSVSSPKAVSLSAQDLEMWVKDIFPPTQLQQLAGDPEKKKNLLKDLKMILAVAQHADYEGYGERPTVKSRIAIQTDIILQEAYKKKYPDVQVSDEEVAAYHKENPDDLNSFLDANPQFKQQAQGPQGDRFKKEYGQIKVLAKRARQEGLESEKSTQVRLLLDRSQVLYQAYVTEYQEKLGETSDDAEVDQYLKEHSSDFKQVRHILISTMPPPPPPPGTDDKDDKDGDDKKPQALSKDEARQKAQSILDRIRKGEDFAKLARENSDDPGSKENGGSLGVITREDPLVPEFKTAAFALKSGEVSDIVETQFGFHIIKAEELDTSALSDPQARQKLSEDITQAKIQKHLDEIVAASRVEIAEDFNIEVPPTPPASSAPAQIEPMPPAQKQ